MSVQHNKFSVNSRLAALESRCNDLEAENKRLLLYLDSELQSRLHDARRVIQDSIVVPKDGRDGVDGKDGAVGPQGEKGERGDVLIPNESEVAAALLALRQKHARLLARVRDNLAALGFSTRAVNGALKATLESIQRFLES